MYLEDLFGLSQFDCLVRPASNFSIIAAKLANYRIEIAPSHYRWENGSLSIENVELCIFPHNSQNYHKFLILNFLMTTFR